MKVTIEVQDTTEMAQLLSLLKLFAIKKVHIEKVGEGVSLREGVSEESLDHTDVFGIYREDPRGLALTQLMREVEEQERVA